MYSSVSCTARRGRTVKPAAQRLRFERAASRRVQAHDVALSPCGRRRRRRSPGCARSPRGRPRRARPPAGWRRRCRRPRGCRASAVRCGPRRSTPARRRSPERAPRPASGARVRSQEAPARRRRRRAAAPSASGRSPARSAARSAKSRASALTTVDVQPAGAAAQLGEQLGVDVQRDHLVPRRARSSVTRPVPAPTSSTGPADARRQLAPQRQVLAVAAALEVVPDDARQLTRTTPRGARRTQLPRSASIAV